VDRIAGKDAGCSVTSRWSTGRRRSGTFIVALLCCAHMLVFASEARAQCSVRDVLLNRLGKASSTTSPKTPIKSAADVSAWKTIAMGTFANAFALVNALDKAHCGIGASAAEVLARPAFPLGTTRTSLELLAVSVTELGFEADTASLADIYERARQLGLGLAPAEAAP